MENTATISILDQIIDSQKAEEVAKLDAVEIINNLFGELSERERDILIRRHGLHGRERETLEKIGQAHNLTRERIRQIETASVRKLQQLNNLGDYIVTLKKVIFQLLEEHGGLMEREYMLDILAGFSLNGLKAKEELKPDICLYPKTEKSGFRKRDILKMSDMPLLAIEIISPKLTLSKGLLTLNSDFSIRLISDNFKAFPQKNLQ